MIRKFTPILFKFKSISEFKKSGYRVFISEYEYKFIESETAQQAIEKSGITNPYKIEKSGIIRKSVFNDDDFLSNSQDDNLKVA